MTFEKGMAKLKDLVSSLEKENISLEESIQSFEEGTKVAKYCKRKLKDAEDRVKAILDQSDLQ
jgi:exodeoxyribonuclease VII small subunit